MTGTLVLDEHNINLSGSFDAQTDLPPYNKFTQNMRGNDLTDKKIALRRLYTYYSWPNITNATSITISWLVAGAYVDFVWTLPANTNYKDVATLNGSLQDFCVANGLYLISGGNNVYFISLVANEVSYKIELNLYKVPTSVGTYTEPSNFAGYPTISSTPKFTIPASSEMCNLIGFVAGTYNGATVSTQFVSSYVPQFNPVSCVYLTCNLAKNDVPINGSTVIGAFTTRGTLYGEMIIFEPQGFLDWYDIDSNSNQLEIQMWDQYWHPLNVQDPRTMIQLSISK